MALLQEFLPELNIVSVELGPQEHIGRDEDWNEVRVEGMDKNEKTEYYKNMRNAFDIKSEKWFAREEGKAEGKAEVAKELKAIGINPDQIAQATGLSIEAVAAL